LLLHLFVQAFGTLASEGAAKVAAQGQASSNELASAVQELQSSTQVLQAAAADSHKADSTLASSLARAATAVGQEASGLSKRSVHMFNRGQHHCCIQAGKTSCCITTFSVPLSQASHWLITCADVLHCVIWCHSPTVYAAVAQDHA
jgi:hypothetical protein